MMNVELAVLLFLALWVCVWTEDSGKVVADRYAVYWNSTNPRSVEQPSWRTCLCRHFKAEELADYMECGILQIC